MNQTIGSQLDHLKTDHGNKFIEDRERMTGIEGGLD